MANPTRFPVFREGDLGINDGPVDGAALRDVFRKLFGQLNPSLDAVNRGSAKGLTLADNIKCDIISGTFTHGVPQNFALKNLTKANGARVLSCASQIPASAPTIQMVAQPASGVKPQAAITLFFNSPLNADGSPTSSSAVVEVLPEGAQSTSIPAFNPATHGITGSGSGSSSALAIGAGSAVWTDLPSTACTFTANAARLAVAVLSFSGFSGGAGPLSIRFILGSFTTSPFNLFYNTAAQHQSWTFQEAFLATTGGSVGTAQACKAQIFSPPGGCSFTMDANDSVSLVIQESG